jgi:hypothetical protein
MIIGSSSHSFNLGFLSFDSSLENESENSFSTRGSCFRSYIHEERFIEELFSSSFLDIIKINFCGILKFIFIIRNIPSVRV